MARRGYFEKQGGEFRLRIVADGYNADNENVPPNKVIIDSRDLRTLSVLRSGVHIVPTLAAGNGVWITQWDLPYIPLCTFQYGQIAATPDYWTGALPGSFIAELLVSRNGIYLDLKSTMPPQWFPMHIRWAAFRIPVTP